MNPDGSLGSCAACHVSLVVTGEGQVVAESTHQMNDRTPWRIFGLIYAHPHPASPDTTVIRNKAGLPLPTELTSVHDQPYRILVLLRAELPDHFLFPVSFCTPSPGPYTGSDRISSVGHVASYDFYSGGKGRILTKSMSVFPLRDVSDDEIARVELMRPMGRGKNAPLEKWTAT